MPLLQSHTHPSLPPPPKGKRSWVSAPHQWKAQHEAVPSAVLLLPKPNPPPPSVASYLRPMSQWDLLPPRPPLQWKEAPPPTFAVEGIDVVIYIG